MRGTGYVLGILGLGWILACGGGSHTDGLTNPGQPPPTNTVTGNITYKGQPLSGVQVTIFDTNGNFVAKTVATDASGNYSVSGLMATSNVPAEFLIWADLSGYGFFPSVGAGAKVTRSGQNALFQGNKVTDIGYNLTAIDYVSTVAGGSLAGADFAAFDGTNPRVDLGSTGQSTSYAVGDDGDLRKGVAWPSTRFTDNQDGTVTDRLTGLIWLKNASFTAATDWTSAITAVNQLASGTAGLTDSSKPGDWRMPNLHEFESLVDVSAASPALTPGHPFTNVSNGVYWTSTSYWGGSTGSPSAWGVRMGDGRYINDGTLNVKTVPNAVWAVKGAGGGLVSLQATGMWVTYQAGDDGAIQAGVRLTTPRFRDNADGTVTDTMTGLIWLKQANAINLPWDQALAAIQTLASGQFGLTDGSKPGDWRMPNRKEMQSLADRMQPNEADYFNYSFIFTSGTVYQGPIFTNFQPVQYYWTSSTTAGDSTVAWTVYSCDYGVYDMPKSGTGYTLAVR